MKGKWRATRGCGNHKSGTEIKRLKFTKPVAYFTSTRLPRLSRSGNAGLITKLERLREPYLHFNKSPSPAVTKLKVL